MDRASLLDRTLGRQGLPPTLKYWVLSGKRRYGISGGYLIKKGLLFEWAFFLRFYMASSKQFRYFSLLV